MSEFSAELSNAKLSEKEFLSKAANLFEECPICKSTIGFEAKGRFVKNIVCRNCKTSWVAGTLLEDGGWKEKYDDNGVHGLRIFYRTGEHKFGKSLENMGFPLEFWLRRDKPYEQFEKYAHTLTNAVERLRTVSWRVGKVQVKGKNVFQFFGPSGDLVAMIIVSMERIDGDNNVVVSVVDYTENHENNPQTMAKNDFFCHLVSLWLHKIGLVSPGPARELPIFTYSFKNKNLIKVEKNRFYPFDPSGIITVPKEAAQELVERNIMNLAEGGFSRYVFWDEENLQKTNNDG